MTEVLAFTPGAGFLVAWFIFLIVVTLIVVPFLLLIIYNLVITAIRINTNARVADIAAVPVRKNTEVVPQLADTLALIREVLGVARIVEGHGADLERTLGRDLPGAVRR